MNICPLYNFLRMNNCPPYILLLINTSPMEQWNSPTDNTCSLYNLLLMNTCPLYKLTEYLSSVQPPTWYLSSVLRPIDEYLTFTQPHTDEFLSSVQPPTEYLSSLQPPTDENLSYYNLLLMTTCPLYNVLLMNTCPVYSLLCQWCGLPEPPTPALRRPDTAVAVPAGTPGRRQQQASVAVTLVIKLITSTSN